jgi:predicted dehydrogenase
MTRAGPGSGRDAASATRLPAGHPEGLVEAFAQIYREVADVITARSEGCVAAELPSTVPTVEDGVLGMAFIDAALRSAKGGTVWTRFNADVAERSVHT